MTGAELKALVANIPDDATVMIAGMDDGGWEWTFHDDAEVKREESGDYTLMGISPDDTAEIMRKEIEALEHKS